MHDLEGPSLSSDYVLWNPPLVGWIKVNVDAAHKVSGSVAVMVVRDANGKLLFLSTMTLSTKSAFDAEVTVLKWAM